MVKLAASVIRIQSGEEAFPVIIADHAGGVEADHNGKFSYISNMKEDAALDNLPDFSTPYLAVGFTRFDELLMADNDFTGTATPLIPTLRGGPAPFGWYEENYWNEEEVESQEATGEGGNLIYWYFPSVFEGFHQLVIKNTSLSKDISDVAVSIDAGEERFIEGGDGTAGLLPPKGAWTIALPDGTAVVVLSDELKEGPALSHPADGNGDGFLTRKEVDDFIRGWQEGDYGMRVAIQALYLEQLGGAYSYDETLPEPDCWVSPYRESAI
jgi:hypothetical protein